MTGESTPIYCNLTNFRGEEAEEGKKQCVSLKMSWYSSLELTAEGGGWGGGGVVFELNAAIVYHPWHFSPAQTGQLLPY